jgi:hypothetical protein
LRLRELVLSVRLTMERLYHGALCWEYGVSLPQADTCLVGDAKRMPHIKVRSAADVRTSSLRRLLRAALAR